MWSGVFVSMLSQCPEPDLFRRFLSGELSDGEADQIEGHVAECLSCGRAMTQRAVLDCTLSSVRCDAATPSPEDAVVEALMGRLRGLHVLIPAMMSSFGEPRRTVSADEECDAFLAP